jgi:uncharacterized lipoprotein YmbA
MSRIICVTLLLFGLLSGCGSTPRSDYYVLSADAPGQPGTSGPAIGVGPVTVPEYLKRGPMVINRDTHRLTLAEFDRWAEPLDFGIRRVVSVNLAVLLDTQEVQNFPWRRDTPPRFGISISVAQFSVKDTEAILIAEWSILDVEARHMKEQRISRFTTSADSNEAESVAAAYSNLLLQLSETIADSIKHIPD